MLIYITGVAGSGKSTLREELEQRGHRAEDADESFCAWFDQDGRQVPTMPLASGAARTGMRTIAGVC